MALYHCNLVHTARICRLNAETFDASLDGQHARTRETQRICIHCSVPYSPAFMALGSVKQALSGIVSILTLAISPATY